MNDFPLNQCYQYKKTMLDYPILNNLKKDYHDFCLVQAGWHKVGRWYDCIPTLLAADFVGKKVCELGARDSIFSSYLTKYVSQIFVSDNFLGWGDLGDLKFWRNLWEEYAYDKEKLIIEMQDMTRLTYEDSSMDVVVSFSAIEHIPRDGDIVAMREMSRICKPGGLIAVGTELGSVDANIGGGYIYTQETIFKRLIDQSGCELIGNHDFDIKSSDGMQNHNGYDFTSVMFFLRKPL